MAPLMSATQVRLAIAEATVLVLTRARGTAASKAGAS